MFINRQVVEQMYITSGLMPWLLLTISMIQSIMQVCTLVSTTVTQKLVFHKDIFGKVTLLLLVFV